MAFHYLVQATQTLNAEDAFRPRLSDEQWRHVAPFFTRHAVRAGDLLLRQGNPDRTMYLLGEGSLQVFASGNTPGRGRVAILRAGAVVGESGLFLDGPPQAHVEAMTPCVVWALRGPRLDELSARLPGLALELLRAAGKVMALRLRAHMAHQTPFA